LAAKAAKAAWQLAEAEVGLPAVAKLAAPAVAAPQPSLPSRESARP